MNLAFIENLVVKYLEAHPELIEKLVTDLLAAVARKIDAQLTQPTPAPTA